MAEVMNHDVAGMCRRINRFIVELHKSVSSSIHGMNKFDQERLATYLMAIKAYRGWVVAQPQLDLPETHPRAIELGPNPDTSAIENEAIRDVMTLMELCRDELIHSQSSRAPAGLLIFDDRRAMALVEKCEAFLTVYIQGVQPLDMPESSPAQPMSGPGLGGV